jgi:hypothetical protein
MPSFYLALFSNFFTFQTIQGVANRGASVRVGRDTEKDGKGKAHPVDLDS